MKNSGLRIRPPSLTDYIFGAETGIVYKEICNDWTGYLPLDEKQRLRKFDTMACVTFSALNSVETQINYLIKNVLNQEQIDFLEDLGFLDGNYRFNASDRFTAKMSGTTKSGNYLTNVGDSIRKDGLLPERDWLPSDDFKWDDYYSEIPQNLKDKAKKILELFDFKYEWVITPEYKPYVKDIITFHTKQAPVQIASPTCPTWSSGNVSACPSIIASHATMIYGLNSVFLDLDHYVPFRKNLALDYPVLWGFKMVVELKKEMPPIPRPNHYFGFILSYGMMANVMPSNIVNDIKALQDILKYEGFLDKKITSTGNYLNQTALALYKWQVAHSVAPMPELDKLKGERVGQKTLLMLNTLYS